MKLGRLREGVAPAVRGEVANFRGKIAAAGLSLVLAGGSFLPQNAEANGAKCGATKIILTEDGGIGTELDNPNITVKDQDSGKTFFDERVHSAVLKDLPPGKYIVKASAEDEGVLVSRERTVTCFANSGTTVAIAMDKPKKEKEKGK